MPMKLMPSGFRISVTRMSVKLVIRATKIGPAMNTRNSRRYGSAKLHATRCSRKCDWGAVGAGWPAPTVWLCAVIGLLPGADAGGRLLHCRAAILRRRVADGDLLD